MWTLIFVLLGIKPALSLETNYFAQAQQPEENKLTFECKRTTESKFPVIVVKPENQPSVVFLSWIPEYFPNSELAWEQCQSVAQKLQTKEDEYGNLDSFQLSTAKVNDISIVCLIQKRQRCVEENAIFSLGNVDKPEEVLNQMLNRDLISENIRGGDFYLRSIPFRWLPF